MTAIDLLGRDGDETRLLLERGCGYSIPIPGRPQRASLPPEGEPAADAVVTLSDVPIELAFRLDRLPAGTEVEALAQSLTLAYASSRAGKEPKVRPVRGKLRGVGIAAAAAAIYPLAVEPARMEQVHVSVHRGDGEILAMVRAARFARAEVKNIVWAHFSSAIAGAGHWDPQAPRTEPPQLWPESSAFAEPGVALQLLPELVDDTRRKADAMAIIPAGEGAELVNLLVAFATNPDPPRHELHKIILDTAAQQLSSVADPAVVSALTSNLHQVRTTHDLRAWVWQCLVAFDRRLGWS